MNHWTALTQPDSVIPQSLERALNTNSMDGGETVKKAKVKPKAKPKRRPKHEAIARDDYLSLRFERSLRKALLMILAGGTMERRTFRAASTKAMHGMGLQGSDTTAHAFNALERAGLAVCEVRLTAKGMEKLGLKGLR